jgi:hypothetical protein
MQKILLLEDFYPLKVEPSKTEACECKFTYPYKSITVRYSEDLLEYWKNKEFSKVDAILMHEMCHPITDPLYAKASSTYRTKDEVEDERERLTDHISNIVSKLTKK